MLKLEEVVLMRSSLSLCPSCSEEKAKLLREIVAKIDGKNETLE